MSQTAQLAQSLHRLAARAWSTLPQHRRQATFGAVDAFVAAPGPAAFLAAVREIRAQETGWRLDRLRHAGAQSSLERGRAAVRAAPAMEAQTREVLVLAGSDPMAGRRLEALALLVEAQHVLKGRAEEAASILKKQLVAQNAARKPKAIPPRKSASRMGA